MIQILFWQNQPTPRSPFLCRKSLTEDTRAMCQIQVFKLLKRPQGPVNLLVGSHRLMQLIIIILFLLNNQIFSLIRAIITSRKKIAPANVPYACKHPPWSGHCKSLEFKESSTLTLLTGKWKLFPKENILRPLDSSYRWKKVSYSYN